MNSFDTGRTAQLETGQEPHVFVRQVQEGQQINAVFLVSRSMVAETRSGKPYLALTLMDSSGAIEARLWDRAEFFAPQAREGAFVRVSATVEQFGGQLQFKLANLKAVDEAGLNPADFFPTSERNGADMAAELQARIAGVQSAELRALLESIFSGDTLARFLTAPAAKRMHHACQGGLAEHTLSMARLALAVAANYPALNADLLMTGVLLHDIAKTEEFTGPRPPIDYTDRGRLLGHLVMGVAMLHQAAIQVKLPQELEDQVAHLILSHHGQLEFGSPVLPMTAEALALHHIDDLDAKMNVVAGLQAEMPPDSYQWSAYQKPLERFLYLQGAAPKERQAPTATAAPSQPAGTAKALPSSPLPAPTRRLRRLGKLPGSPRLPERLRQRLHRQPDSGHGNRTAKKKTRPEKQDDSRQLGLF